MQQDFFDLKATNVASEKSPHIFSISELTQQIKTTLETGFVDLWISGQITNFRDRTGRHWYFALKDDKSQIGAVIFNAQAKKIPFNVKDGLEVVCHGELNVYPPRGNYSFIIDEIEPKGIGALQLAFEELKKKLQDEGLFAKERKKPLPFLPKKIGVVTSPTGAAIRDILNIVQRRFPGLPVLLHPAKVQGEGAALEIAAAIHAMNQRNDIDVLIVGRGGGSIEDLWCFNEEVVARAIFASRIPIISAVGHEIDFTIADFVADVRAPTPSAAAEIVVPVMEELRLLIAERRRQLKLALRQLFVQQENRLNELKSRLKDPSSRFPDLLLRIDSFRQRLLYSMNVSLERRRQAVGQLASNLQHLSPLNVLAKGYAVVQRTDTALAVRSSADLQVGDDLRLLFHQGSAEAKITKIERVTK